jgi:hypothetical protein
MDSRGRIGPWQVRLKVNKKTTDPLLVLQTVLCTIGAYYVPYSCLLISNKFVMGGSGPSRAIKFLYAPAPPPPSVWALKPPL